MPNWVEIKKGTPVAQMVVANRVPPTFISPQKDVTHENHEISVEERQKALMEKLNLSSWNPGQRR